VIDYEILLLLDPELTDEQQADLVGRTRELIEKGGGTVDRHDAWGRRKLAYEIEKKGEGSYHLLLFSSTPETLDEVSRVLKIDDAVLRHMATRRGGGSLPEPGSLETASTETASTEAGPPAPVAVGARESDDAEDDSAAAPASAGQEEE
jgi:small subunit ribosomal protein S6